MSRHFDSRPSSLPKKSRGFPDAWRGLQLGSGTQLNHFGHETATVVAICPEDLKRGNHAALKPHHLALVRVTRVPTDGEIAALPAIRCLDEVAFVDGRGHEFSDGREKLSVINRPAISTQIAGSCWLAPIQR